jgi:hypothetical protein
MRELKRIHIHWYRCDERLNAKLRELDASDTLGCAGKTYSKPSGHAEGGTRPGRTRKKPKDLSACDREECGCGEGGGVYVVYMCERVS